MNKPVMLFVYDYLMPPWLERKPNSMQYLLEQALGEFFEVKHLGEIHPVDADVVFNTLPLWAEGGVGECLFTKGRITMMWNQTPLEGMLPQFLPDLDIMFCGTPKFVKDIGDKGRLLLPALDPSYQYDPDTEFEFEVGHLGSEVQAYRINLLDALESKFNLMRMTNKQNIPLGQRSAIWLSKCKMMLSVEDWHHHNAGIEFRFWTYGNVRPILMHNNPDMLVVGKPHEMYIPYESEGDLHKQIRYYLDHPTELEAIGDNLKKHLQTNHTYRHRALQVLEEYERLKK